MTEECRKPVLGAGVCRDFSENHWCQSGLAEPRPEVELREAMTADWRAETEIKTTISVSGTRASLWH